MSLTIMRRISIVAAVLATIPCSESRGQEYFPSPAIGVRGGYDSKLKTGLVGALFTIPMDGRYEIGVGVDFHPRVGFDQFRASGDVLYRFGNWGSIYGGVGIAMIQGPNSTEVGISGKEGSEFGYNVFSGYEFLRGSEQSLRPFFEVRYTSSRTTKSAWLLAGVSIVLETGGYGTLTRIPPRPRD